MLLRNTDRFRDILEISINDGARRRFLLEEGQKVKTNGFFVVRSGEMFELFAHDGDIFVACRGELLKCSADVLTEVENRNEDERTFLIYKKGVEIVRLSYAPERPMWNFFSEEDEDVDGLLLIHNILSSAERKTIFLEANNGQSKHH